MKKLFIIPFLVLFVALQVFAATTFFDDPKVYMEKYGYRLELAQFTPNMILISKWVNDKDDIIVTFAVGQTEDNKVGICCVIFKGEEKEITRFCTKNQDEFDGLFEKALEKARNAK